MESKEYWLEKLSKSFSEEDWNLVPEEFKKDFGFMKSVLFLNARFYTKFDADIVLNPEIICVVKEGIKQRTIERYLSQLKLGHKKSDAEAYALDYLYRESKKIKDIIKDAKREKNNCKAKQTSRFQKRVERILGINNKSNTK